jgi:hypothetical protein
LFRFLFLLFSITLYCNFFMYHVFTLLWIKRICYWFFTFMSNVDIFNYLFCRVDFFFKWFIQGCFPWHRKITFDIKHFFPWRKENINCSNIIFWIGFLWWYCIALKDWYFKYFIYVFCIEGDPDEINDYKYCWFDLFC